MDDVCFSYVDVDYCKYGMPYRKITRLWNNVLEFKPRPLCKKDCNSMVGNKNMCIAQQSTLKTHKTNQFKQSELYRIPTELIQDIFSYMV